jgi:predicted Mrr-cat superfamily restriction endonuclease
MHTPQLTTERNREIARKRMPRKERAKKLVQEYKWCMFLADSIFVLERDSKEFLLAKRAIKDCKKHLRGSERDLECLYVLGTLLALTGNKSGDIEVEEKIEQTKLLIDTGILKSPTPTDVNLRNDGQDLERKTALMLEAMGLRTLKTQAGADGGIDIEAYSSNPIWGGKYIIQCKDWSQPVGEPVIRDLYGLVIAEAANKGIVIAANGFTISAKEFAEGKQLELIDGTQLEALLRQHGVS